MFLSNPPSPYVTPRLSYKTPKQSEIDALKKRLAQLEDELKFNEDLNQMKDKQIQQLQSELNQIREILEKDFMTKKAKNKVWRETLCTLGGFFN
jgi:predicted  nucleic acid-binding Zn-ribbon protein